MSRYLNTTKSVCATGLTLLCLSSWAQNSAIILKAMQDELKRSLTEIKYEGHDAPFYISYGITDTREFNVYATLGSLVQSGEYSNRGKSVRVLVGNYSFNDESLDNNLFSEPTANEIQLPIEDDYFGIRRALWTTTDVVYKGAAQKYKKHQSTLNAQHKSLNDLPHRTFAKLPSVQIIDTSSNYTLAEEKWRDYCKQVSAVFLSFPAVESSDAMVNISYGTKYFVSSEGTIVAVPQMLSMFHCRAQVKTEAGEPIFDNITYYAKYPDEFPPLATALQEAKGLAEKLTAMRNANALPEIYSGPVLFMGQAVAEAFASSLFSFRESLVASNAILSANDFRPESSTNLDSRVGKTIADNTLTVTAKPTLTAFQGIPLIGSYKVDDEGVIPPDVLTLVDRGVLRDLLNDRSLTREDQAPNGHSNGPAVINLTVDNAVAIDSLKNRLITAAKHEGLEFAIIVRGHAQARSGMVNLWKVNLDTGREELLRPAQLSDLTLKHLRRILGASSDHEAYVALTEEGNLASFIAPNALLLEDVDLAPIKLPYLQQDKFVPHPLLK